MRGKWRKSFKKSKTNFTMERNLSTKRNNGE